MYSTIPLAAPDTYLVGASDRRLTRFENLFPIPRGVSYNSYLILDEQTVLLDTVDKAAAPDFLSMLESALDGRTLDYVVVHHMEPDHCAALAELALRWPDLKLICTAKAKQMLGQFFRCFSQDDHIRVVAEGDTLCTGQHTLKFFTAPMVHWPEVMVSYDSYTKALFSADAFGTFGALDGSIFADELDFAHEWLADARRYYANIVGKYGGPVQTLLKKASALDIQVLCPLHGPVWRKDIPWFIEKYDLWSRWQPEGTHAAVFYGSMYGNTATAAQQIARQIRLRGAGDVPVYDVSSTDVSDLVGEVARCSHIVLASPTYNGGIYPKIRELLTDLKELGVQNRTWALVENGTWAPTSARLMRTELDSMKNMTVLEPVLTIHSALLDPTPAIALADTVADSMGL